MPKKPSSFRQVVLLIMAVYISLILSIDSAMASDVNAETDQPIVLGAGYDPAFGVALDVCVQWEKSTEEKWEKSTEEKIDSSTGVKSIFYNLTLIEDIEELEKSLGLSASAKYGSASGKASFSTSIKMNSYNVYVLVEVKVKNQAATISLISLPDNILDHCLQVKDFEKLSSPFLAQELTDGNPDDGPSGGASEADGTSIDGPAAG